MPDVKDLEVRIPEVDMFHYKPNNPVEVPITKSEICTVSASPNIVRHIEFDVSGTLLENSILPGQTVGVLPPGEDENGRPHKLRLYSTCSPTGGEYGEGKIYATTVKREIDEDWETQKLILGVCSNYLCSKKAGEKVLMTGPGGKQFLLPENPEDFNYIFLATGTGIAPFRGMVLDLMRLGMTNEVILSFGCPYRTDLLYNDLFDELAEKHKNFHYLKSISREDPRPDGSKPYVQYSIIDQKALMLPILEKKNTLIYACGLKGMETGIFQILAMLGLYDYLDLKDEVKDVDPLKWSENQLKRKVNPSERLFLEVY
ncbi:hypothetical protein [Rhodohalobacter sulfatireducens]|uniref:FAD-binding FR-type domain-containing protein n=1 Tax=Rhodohalobacter sulfatireducens TaxID=2911366 RepID=A0ABS9K926_9BACT|nr:hypothetical protein [Rhodohalobacter sulfatireducens]MCG2587345.1 hypothetical protein [Rhodohalobacter sulfatireducens]